MPVCEGLPDGPCPQKRNDKSVTIGKGDLLLCQSCDTERRRLFDQAMKLSGTHIEQPEGGKQPKSTRSASVRAGSTSTLDSQQQSQQAARTHILTSSSATASNDALSAPPPRPTAAPAGAIIINELLAYAIFYRDNSKSDDLHKLIVGFYLPTEIAESKRILLQEFSAYLEDCPYKTARRHSATRSAHDAEVEDILCMVEILDNGDVLDKSVRFAAVSFDRVPSYGPNEINVCAVADRQHNMDKQITELRQKMDDLSAVQTDSALITPITASIFDNQLKPITDKIQDQLNAFTSTCNKLHESLKERMNQVSANNGQLSASSTLPVDRSMNVVITGVTENRDATIWRETITQALNHAAGREIDIVDAFRLGRFMEGKNRPVLVKLGSVWNRRLIMAGARKLRNVNELQRVFITADEPLEVRRQNTLERLKYRAQREHKQVSISHDGVLSIDGVETFCIQRGFISSQSSANNNNRNGM